MHVFLSYSVKDLHHVYRLRETLRAYGLKCWPARILTPGSEHWLANVENAVARAACVVAVLSPDTLEARWVSMALDYAAVYHIPVIPVVVSGEPGHILLVRLEGLDWFDLRYRSRYLREIAALAALLRRCMAERLVEMA